MFKLVTLVFGYVSCKCLHKSAWAC